MSDGPPEAVLVRGAALAVVAAMAVALRRPDGPWPRGAASVGGPRPPEELRPPGIDSSEGPSPPEELH